MQIFFIYNKSILGRYPRNTNILYFVVLVEWNIVSMNEQINHTLYQDKWMRREETIDEKDLFAMKNGINDNLL